MASHRTRLRTIRIRNDVADYFEGKALNRAVEDIYDKIVDERVRFTGEGIEIIERYDMSAFERACKRIRVQPQRLIDNLAKEMEKNSKELKLRKKEPKEGEKAQPIGPTPD